MQKFKHMTIALVALISLGLTAVACENQDSDEPAQAGETDEQAAAEETDETGEQEQALEAEAEEAEADQAKADQAKADQAKAIESTTVDVPADGKKFDPPVEKAEIPTGAWFCDMNTVHYARMEEGDGSCPECGMKLKQMPGADQPNPHAGHDHE